jgi:hypothetical protein
MLRLTIGDYESRLLPFDPDIIDEIERYLPLRRKLRYPVTVSTIPDQGCIDEHSYMQSG